MKKFFVVAAFLLKKFFVVAVFLLKKFFIVAALLFSFTPMDMDGEELLEFLSYHPDDIRNARTLPTYARALMSEGEAGAFYLIPMQINIKK